MSVWDSSAFTTKQKIQIAQTATEWIGRHTVLADIADFRVPQHYVQSIFRPVTRTARCVREFLRPYGSIGRRYGAINVSATRGQSLSVLLKAYNHSRAWALGALSPESAENALKEWRKDAAIDRRASARCAAAHAAMQRDALDAG